MIKNNIKNLILLFSGLFLVLSWHPVKITHNTLKTDYVKVDITWTPPNNAPTISSGPAESPESSSASPTNAGSDVSFYATGTDPDGDNYYLAICKTDAVTAGNNAAPTCNDGEWCISGSTASASGATCSTTTLAAWSSSNAWYAFVCDHNASGLCSSSSQGSGNTGSPFEVNHRPSDFDTCDVNPGSMSPGGDVNFSLNVYGVDDDGDNVNMFLCASEGATASGCSGTEYCGDTSCGTTCLCSGSSTIPSEGVQLYYIYTFDEHGFGASNNASSCAFVVNNVAPVNSSLSLNGGSTIDLSTGGEGPDGNKDINTVVTVTDNNGCSDVTSVVAKNYPSGVGAGSCSSQDNNICYYDISCSGGSCVSGITKTYTCTANFKYHADPTDAGDREAETWKATVVSSDEIAYDTDESSGVELQSFNSLNVSASIGYGTLETGEMSSTTAMSATTTVFSTGNTGIDVQLSGTNMASGGNTILVGQQRYATSALNYENGTALTTSPTSYDLNVAKTTITATPSVKDIWWGLQIPANTAGGNYSGTNTFTAE